MNLSLASSVAFAQPQNWGIQYFPLPAPSPFPGTMRLDAPAPLPVLRPETPDLPTPAPGASTPPQPVKRKRGRPPINDQFSRLKMSRQRKWQLRQDERGLCVICGKPKIGKNFCLEHLVANREMLARKRGFKRQYQNCISRALERLATSPAPAPQWQAETIHLGPLGLNHDLEGQRRFLEEKSQQGWELTKTLFAAGGDTTFLLRRKLPGKTSMKPVRQPRPRRSPPAAAPRQLAPEPAPAPDPTLPPADHGTEAPPLRLSPQSNQVAHFTTLTEAARLRPAEHSLQ